MNSVLALDSSAAKAGIVRPDGTVEVLVPPNAVGTGVGRLHWWCSTHRRRIDAPDRAPDVIAVEAPAFSKANQGTIANGMVRGVAALAAGHAIDQDRWVDIGAGSIKRYATVKGIAGKDDVKAACCRRFDWNGQSDDESDALGLWALVRDAVGEPVVDVPQRHQDAQPQHPPCENCPDRSPRVALPGQEALL